MCVCNRVREERTAYLSVRVLISAEISQVWAQPLAGFRFVNGWVSRSLDCGFAR